MNCNLSLIPVTATPPEFKQSLNPGGVFLHSAYIKLKIYNFIYNICGNITNIINKLDSNKSYLYNGI